MLELRDRLAATQHSIWAQWMLHLFSICTLGADESMIIPAVQVETWRQQIETEYANLSEQEREHALKQADEILEVLALYEQDRVKSAASLARRTFREGGYANEDD